MKEKAKNILKIIASFKHHLLENENFQPFAINWKFEKLGHKR